jgi:hypothetical protein
MIEGWDPVVVIELLGETKEEYHRRRVKEEDDVIVKLMVKDGTKADIKRARKRRKYHQKMVQEMRKYRR